MSKGDIHAENREWAFQSLDALQSFLDDPDFQGEIGEERATIERKRKELRDGKYRVVFLGAFNVGKSTLINALLGDEYLPTVLEECTAKITHVAKADEMRTVITLASPASEEELRALGELLSGYGVDTQVSQTTERCELVIAYRSNAPKELRASLNALITLSAEENYPRLRSLRGKFEEIYVYLPAVLLEDDIALIDSPGVHSISQSATKLTEDIIPHSHLVVCLIDSQSAGNKQDRGFIEMIVKHRRRKVMFVINKADQLNAEEIDLLGHRGPAKDLFRSLEGVVEGPELFFISSLYALISRQLENRHITLDVFDANNKIKIPFGTQRELLQRDAPEQAVATYLAEQSRMPTFRERLIEYLYHENKEGAILESVCHFLSTEAWKLVRPLEVQLEMARNIPRLDELKRIRGELTDGLEANRAQAETVMGAFSAASAGAASAGGEADGVTHAGYDALVEGWLNRKMADEKVLGPLRQWINYDENMKKAKKARYEPLRDEIGVVLDRFVVEAIADINRAIETIEQPFLERLGQLQPDVDVARPDAITVSRAKPGAIHVDMAASYIGFFLGGAAVCAAVGAVVAGWTEAGTLLETTLSRPEVAEFLDKSIPAEMQNMKVMGALIGAVVGAVGGIVARVMSAKGTRRREAEALATEEASQILFSELTKEGVASVKTQLQQSVQKRRAELAAALEGAFGAISNSITSKLDAATAEEESLRRKQEEIIARLEPKIEMLKVVMDTARGIAEASALE